MCISLLSLNIFFVVFVGLGLVAHLYHTHLERVSVNLSIYPCVWENNPAQKRMRAAVHSHNTILSPQNQLPLSSEGPLLSSELQWCFKTGGEAAILITSRHYTVILSTIKWACVHRAIVLRSNINYIAWGGNYTNFSTEQNNYTIEKMSVISYEQSDINCICLLILLKSRS